MISSLMREIDKKRRDDGVKGAASYDDDDDDDAPDIDGESAVVRPDNGERH